MAEIQHVLALFPNLDPTRILFTPNFAPRTEYAFALKVRSRHFYPPEKRHAGVEWGKWGGRGRGRLIARQLGR